MFCKIPKLSLFLYIQKSVNIAIIDENNSAIKILTARVKGNNNNNESIDFSEILTFSNLIPKNFFI